MNLQRNILFIALLLLSFFIWQRWESDQAEQKNSTNLIIKEREIPRNDYPSNLVNGQTQLIRVRTDVLSLGINPYGGDINEAELLSYHKTLHSSEPFRLLETSKDFLYQATSGFISNDQPSNNYLRPLYISTTTSFVLQDGQNELRVPLTFTGPDGVIYQKIYVLERGKYNISIEYKIYNYSAKPLTLAVWGQLKQTLRRPQERGIKFLALHPYRGIAYSADNINYQKYSLSHIKDNYFKINTTGGWIAMFQQYFTTAWIPRDKDQKTFYTMDLDKSMAIIGYQSAPITIAANSNYPVYTTTLWIGPALQSEMAAVARHLDLTVDYGWWWFISQPLFKLLKFINSFVDNWGLAIIIMTVIVRGLLYKLTKLQYTSMAKLRMLQPKIAALRERFGDDKHRLSKEIMALYKAEKLNPLGGYLPLLIQMPIFLAIYAMLMGSVELRHAHFIGWIKDLSAPDNYYILPLLMGLTIYLLHKMSLTKVKDDIQHKLLQYIPIVFVVFFFWLPSGLVLYYIISNIMTIIQQKIINRELVKLGLYKRCEQEH